jgi:hypothetical protein
MWTSVSAARTAPSSFASTEPPGVAAGRLRHTVWTEITQGAPLAGVPRAVTLQRGRSPSLIRVRTGRYHAGLTREYVRMGDPDQTKRALIGRTR